MANKELQKASYTSRADIAEKLPHDLILESRQKLRLTGVTDVDSFDESTIVLYTQLGELNIRGRDLHINSMSVESGDLTVEGDIWSIVYGDKERSSKPSAFSKLFR